MSLREWLLRRKALEDEMRAQEQHTLAIVNTVRGIVGADPIRPGGATRKQTADTDALDAMKWRYRDWWEN